MPGPASTHGASTPGHHARGMHSGRRTALPLPCLRVVHLRGRRSPLAQRSGAADGHRWASLWPLPPLLPPAVRTSMPCRTGMTYAWLHAALARCLNEAGT
jgi:hypothetical protein